MIRAAVLEVPNAPLAIREIELGEQGPHEVIVKTAAVGLCRSDLHIIEGKRPVPLPAILGHEVSGVVEATGSLVNDLAIGDHVVGCLSVFCGRCRQCVSGHQVICEDVTVKMPPGVANRIKSADGKINQVFNLSGFAEKLLVHRNALVKICKEMPLDRAALLGCAVLTGTGAVFRTAQVPEGATVAVIGVGGVGLSVINGAAIANAKTIIAIDRVPEKLELAKRFGATHAINASQEDTISSVCNLSNGGVDYAFECIGLPQTALECFQMLAPRGIGTVVGVFEPNAIINLPAEGFLHERRLQGSFMGSNRLTTDIPRLVDLYLKKKLFIDDLISKRISLDEINDGFDAMRSGRIARAVVVFPDAV